MRINTTFFTATSEQVKATLDHNFVPGTGYLVLSPRDHLKPFARATNPTNEPLHRLIIPIVKGRADMETNNIGRWLNDEDVFEQEYLYGKDYEKYSIALYKFPEYDPSFPSVIAEFVLTDYLFEDRTPGHVKSFDDLMCMLDRDKLGTAVKEALIEEGFRRGPKLNYANPPADITWVRDFRIASHTDHAYVASQRPAPALLVH